MVVLLFTIFDFSHFFWALLTVQNGVTQGTRFAITNRQLSGLNREQSIRKAIQDATPGIALADADITFFNVTTNSAGAGGPNQTIRVSVRHEIEFFTPIMHAVFSGGSVTFQASSTMKNEPPP